MHSFIHGLKNPSSMSTTRKPIQKAFISARVQNHITSVFILFTYLVSWNRHASWVEGTFQHLWTQDFAEQESRGYFPQQKCDYLLEDRDGAALLQ
ncbi:hypothetical protein KP509_06G047400 [Ceratopteris richardii]|uniref:Uncharacterized protein n=1 Tax=Ceratopteris richardii TaxID=49495 RepID=A0A8T2UMP2_CERRI|nr:hypothetical protein KP509_06G047400 [Ceratopteris richardii]